MKRERWFIFVRPSRENEAFISVTGKQWPWLRRIMKLINSTSARYATMNRLLECFCCFFFTICAIRSLLNPRRTYHLAHYEWILLRQLMMLTMSINSMMIDVWINHQSEDLRMHAQCIISLHECMLLINIAHCTYWFQKKF